MENLSLRPLGSITSPYRQKFGTPRQSRLVPEAEAKLILDPLYCPPGCLQGLEGFSHLWLIFGFHQNRPGNVQGKVHPPRLKGEKIGLFATRSPHRPNPLGLSLVELKHIDFEPMTLTLRGVDLIDGTPVFDFKPYIPEYDSTSSSQTGWLESVEDRLFTVHWDCCQQGYPEDYIQLAEKSLQRDLRNLEDQNLNNSGPFRSLIGDYDVQFIYDGDRVIVQELRLSR